METLNKRVSLYHSESTVWPLIDLYETGSELVIEIDLPGIMPEDMSITAYGEIMIIEGVRRNARSEADLNYICVERGIRGFRRVIKFPVPVDISRGSAWCERGVTSVRFPKMEPRTIKINMGRTL